MNIRRNEDWGELAPLPADVAVYDNDRAVSQMIEAAWRDCAPISSVALVGGDLRRALGGRRDQGELRVAPEVLRVKIDVGELAFNGSTYAFVAHAVARRSWWFGPIFAAMNSEWPGEWIVAPRAHPADGRLDLVEGRLNFGDRIKARRRLPTGTHVPHPSISTRPASVAELDFGRPLPIYVDGQCVGVAAAISLRVHDEALVVHV